jgi:hypothetical protein
MRDCLTEGVSKHEGARICAKKINDQTGARYFAEYFTDGLRVWGYCRTTSAGAETYTEAYSNPYIYPDPNARPNSNLSCGGPTGKGIGNSS